MAFREAVPDERAPYTDESRARLALAAAARELSDFARGFVPIYPGHLAGAADDVLANEIEEAARLVDHAEAVLESMVVYASVSGASWEVIGAGLGTSRQSAHKKYRQAVDDFRAALAQLDADTDASRRLRRRYPAAHKPDYWAPRLDAWVEHHREPTEGGPPIPAVSGGLTRLGPLAELMLVGQRRSALLKEYLVPPVEKVLPLAERELELLRQLGAAGHEVAGEITRLDRQIAELRATVAEASADGSAPASADT